MKVYKEYNIHLPDYSASYLINDDSSGINEEEVQSIDKFMSKFYNEADSINGSIVIDIGENEPSFTWNPAFGLACNCFETKITILIS